MEGNECMGIQMKSSYYSKKDKVKRGAYHTKRTTVIKAMVYMQKEQFLANMDSTDLFLYTHIHIT